jgi:hypothetical protein
VVCDSTGGSSPLSDRIFKRAASVPFVTPRSLQSISRVRLINTANAFGDIALILKASAYELAIF